MKVCWQCKRANPEEGRFCYNDGVALMQGAPAAPVPVSQQPFASPFTFRSGRACHNFDELARMCWQEGPAAVEAVRHGELPNFLQQIGRGDLAREAQAALAEPSPGRALDRLLAHLPSQGLQPAKLQVLPAEINLGAMQIGEARQFQLRLHNPGQRLLHGTLSTDDCLWLSFGATDHCQQKVFECRDGLDVPVHVVGRRLSASAQPVEAGILIESNAGQVVVKVRVQVAVKPFPSGVLAGAITPRQLADRAKTHPMEAAGLFASGAVADWYRANGWSYPVVGPTSAGPAALQQFFEAMGLAQPPRVTLTETSVHLQGLPGSRVRHQFEVRTDEQRFVYALATSNQPWLLIEPTMPHGQTTPVGLVVPAVPNQPGETLQARVTVRANGQQRFVVPVMLSVAGGHGRPAPAPPVFHQPPVPAPPSPVAAAPTPAASPPPQPWSQSPVMRRIAFKRLLPAALLGLVIVVMVIHDLFFTSVGLGDGGGLLDTTPRIELHWHPAADKFVPFPTDTFGLVALQDKTQAGQPKRLTFDAHGRTNNTVLRIDGQESILGHGGGRWLSESVPVGKDSQGRERDGQTAVWLYDGSQIAVTQTAVVVPGPTSRLLDTCLVTYQLENRDTKPHGVGLRFLLDTFIGDNDGVPFTLPGSQTLCDTMHEFPSPGQVPDFLQALEYPDLTRPGTIAHLQLRLGGRIETPARVLLTAWPSVKIRDQGGSPLCKGENAGWDVPMLSMQTLTPSDSCVVMYWPELELAPGTRREVGFTYGLGAVASGEGGGRLALTVGGALFVGNTFTVTAYVNQPQPGERVTLEVPPGLQLVSPAEQIVPPVPAGARSPNSPVSWKVKAVQRGPALLRVKSSGGAAQSLPLRIEQQSIFD